MKVFKSFLDYLHLHRQDTNWQERDEILTVLNRFKYEILHSSPRLETRVTSYIPSVLRLTYPLVLLVHYVCILIYICYIINGLVVYYLLYASVGVIVSSNVVLAGVVVWIVYLLVCHASCNR